MLYNSIAECTTHDYAALTSLASCAAALQMPIWAVANYVV